jgi:hypothetical protein
MPAPPMIASFGSRNDPRSTDSITWRIGWGQRASTRRLQCGTTAMRQIYDFDGRKRTDQLAREAVREEISTNIFPV